MKDIWTWPLVNPIASPPPRLKRPRMPSYNWDDKTQAKPWRFITCKVCCSPASAQTKEPPAFKALCWPGFHAWASGCMNAVGPRNWRFVIDYFWEITLAHLWPASLEKSQKISKLIKITRHFGRNGAAKLNHEVAYLSRYHSSCAHSQPRDEIGRRRVGEIECRARIAGLLAGLWIVGHCRVRETGHSKFTTVKGGGNYWLVGLGNLQQSGCSPECR